MSVDVLLKKQVKCRKAHRCIWCGEIIEAGATVPFCKYVFDGAIHNDHYHLECWAVLLEYDWCADGEGFDAYTFKRGTEEPI